MNFQLKTPIVVTKSAKTVQTVSDSFSTITYVGFSDYATQKLVLAQYKVGKEMRSVVLWKGAAYDAAGQYTDEQAQARFKEVMGAE